MRILDCKQIKEDMLTEAKIELTKIFGETGKKTKLTVIQVEGDPASDVYIRNKQKAAEDCNIEFEHIKLPSDITEENLRKVIKAANKDIMVTALMLQMPLPEHLKGKEQSLIDEIDWKKDVDGLTSTSVGKLWTNQECVHPATAEGVMRLLSPNLSGASVLLINRSNLIGKPLTKILENKNATITLAHSKTDRNDLARMMKDVDIIITATGQPRWISRDDVVRQGAFTTYNVSTIIDCGMCRDENNKLCGDVDTNSFNEIDCYITTTPGGTGLTTVAQLILNVVKCYKLQKGEI